MNFSETLSLFRQGKGTARSHMKNLIEMAAVDGNFDDVEYDLLKSIAKRNGISESKLKDIRENPQGIVFEVPAEKDKKFQQLYDLVNMMTIDKAVHAEEAKLCQLFAIKFGYNRQQAEDLISAVRANIENGQGPTETMKRVALMIG